MKKIAVVLIVAAISLQVHAQGTAMDFIRADRNPVTLGLAGSGYASLSTGTAFSAFANPAAVPLSGRTLNAAGTFGLMPSGDGKGLMYGAGASLRLGGFGVSAAFSSGNYPKVPLASDGGGASGQASPRDMIAGLGLSFSIGEHLSFGALARYASNTLDAKTTLRSFSADVLAMYRLNGFSVCAGVVALGPKVNSVSNRSYSLPASAKLAAAYKLGLGDFGVDFMADGDYYFNGNISAAAGVQGSFKDMVFLRTGYRYSGAKSNFTVAPVPSFFSVGAGVKFFGASLDAAYVLASGPSSGTLMLALGYAF